MHTATMEEVQSHLPDLLDKLAPGEDIVITRDGKPVARLTPEFPRGADDGGVTRRKFGTLQGTVLSMEHFDEPLEEFEEYM